MRKLIAVLALLFFFTPLVLYGAGVRARPFENRPLAEAPSISDGWDAFDGVTRFVVDRLPLREQAVKANTWASVNVFDTTPDYSGGTAAGGNKTRDALPFGEPDQAAKPDPSNANAQPDSSVLAGRDDWLFLETDLTTACKPYLAWPQVMARYDRLLDVIRDSGRKVVFTIAPDKSSIYSDYLPESGFAEQDCYAAGKRETWKRLEGSGRPDVLPLRKALLAGKADPPEETYWPTDSHWNTKGAIQAAQAVLAHLGGPPIADAEIRRGRAEHDGDLAKIVGSTDRRSSPEWRIERPAGAARYPGRTVLLADSFGPGLSTALKPYMENLVTVQWRDTPLQGLIDAILAADTVILEKAERDVTWLVSEQGVIPPGFVDGLEIQLTAAG